MVVDVDPPVAVRKLKLVEGGTSVGERTGAKVLTSVDGCVEHHESGRASCSDRRRVPQRHAPADLPEHGTAVVACCDELSVEECVRCQRGGGGLELRELLCQGLPVPRPHRERSALFQTSVRIPSHFTS